VSTPPPPGWGPPPGYGPPPGPGSGFGVGPPSSEDRLWGLAAHLSGIVASFIALGFLGPLVVLLLQGQRSPFVRRHAVEALNFQLMLLILSVLAIVGVVVTFGIGALVIVPLGILVAIGALVLIIVAAVAANNGQDYRYPVNLRIVK
jgi:uncharacterized protein